MSTHRSCCCEEPLKEVYGLMMQTIRWKRPEDILVQAATRNFFLFHEIGAKGICYAANEIFGLSGMTLVSLEKTDEFDDYAREYDQDLCDRGVYQCGELGISYFGDFANIRGGTWYNLDYISGITGAISALTGPIYLGTYKDAYIPGITGGLVDSVLGSTWAETRLQPGEEDTYNIFYEYDLFLPEELRNANIASIKGEYDYFDRFCQNDTGECFGDTLSGLTGWRIFDDGYEINPYRNQYWTNSGRNYTLPIVSALQDDVFIGSNIDQRTYIPVISEFYTTITNHTGDKSYLSQSDTEYQHENLGAIFAYRNILKKSNTGFTFEYWEPNLVDLEGFPIEGRVEYFTFKNKRLYYSFYSRDDVYVVVGGSRTFTLRYGTTIRANDWTTYSGKNIGIYFPPQGAVRGVYTNTTFKYWDYFKTDWKFECENGANFGCLNFKGPSNASWSPALCRETNPGIAELGGISGATIGNWESQTKIKTKIHSKTKFNFSKGMSTISDLLTHNKPTKNTYGLTLSPRHPFAVGQNIDRSWFSNIKPLLNIYKNITFPKQDVYSNYARQCGLPDPTINEEDWVKRTRYPYTYPTHPYSLSELFKYVTEEITYKRYGIFPDSIARGGNGMNTDYCVSFIGSVPVSASNNNTRIFYTDFNKCPNHGPTDIPEFGSARSGKPNFNSYYDGKNPLYETAVREAAQRPIVLSVVRLTPIRYTDKTTKTTKIKYFITGEYPYNYDVNGIWDGVIPGGPASVPFVGITYGPYDSGDLCDEVTFLRITNDRFCCDECQLETYPRPSEIAIKCSGGCNSDDLQWKCDERYELSFLGSGIWNVFDPSYTGKVLLYASDLISKRTITPAFSNWITTSLTGPNENKKILFWGGEGKTENENTFSEQELQDIPTALLKRWLFNYINNPSNYCNHPLFGITTDGIKPLLDNQEIELKLGYGFPNLNSAVGWRDNVKNRPYYVYTFKRSGNKWQTPGSPFVEIYEGYTVDPMWILNYSARGFPIVESKNYFGYGKEAVQGAVSPGPGICKPSINGNNIWYGVKNYAKDVYKCGISGECEAFNTTPQYSRFGSVNLAPQHPFGSFFNVYPKGHTLIKNMCKRLIDFFGVITGPDDPDQRYLNLQSVFPVPPQKMNIGETYDWRMPLYASNDADFQSVFWKYSSGITTGYTLDGWSQYQL